MGMIIFLTAVVVEISLAAFCIITKSIHKKVRSIIRIASFVGFVLLAILPVIDWSLRYYALGSLLLLLSIIGAITLIQKKEEKREYKAVLVVLKAIGMTVLIFALTLPAIMFPQNKAVVDTTGEYQIATKTYTYIDTSRVESYTDTNKNRKLNVQLWYPDNSDGTYPLIVFSHGGLGIKSSNESLYNELASHGYVVFSIDHTYQCFYTTDEDGDTTLIDLGYMQELFNEDPQSDIHKSYEYYQKWMKIRTDDINFVIDYIITQAKNNNADMAYKLVDITKIGVMGHSLGGSGALGIGRIRDDVNAVIALESPFMYDIEGIEDGRFVFTDEIYPVPVLNVYSDSSWGILAQRPQYAANYSMLSDTNATTFNVYISGVGHLALTDFALTSPILTRILDGKKTTTETVYCLKTINKVCLEFFNSYLKGEGEFTSSGSY
ncbi:MAG: acetylxylan esterase [Desulfotomaculaceae bacterium]|nr:acetylxylan esterase [Desulfotomaculaceae bacterium]